MAKYIEPYQAWGDRLTRPIWTDVQGWQEVHCSITEASLARVHHARLASGHSPRDHSAQGLCAGQSEVR